MRDKIVAFCCENSAVIAADDVDAGHPVMNAVEIISLPCSGKVEIGRVLKCLEDGAPAVLIMACPKDGCKYISGNRRAEKRIEELKKALSNAGLDEGRVHMDFLSSVDSPKFIEIVSRMTALLSEEE